MTETVCVKHRELTTQMVMTPKTIGVVKTRKARHRSINAVCENDKGKERTGQSVWHL